MKVGKLIPRNVFQLISHYYSIVIFFFFSEIQNYFRDTTVEDEDPILDNDSIAEHIQEVVNAEENIAARRQ